MPSLKETRSVTAAHTNLVDLKPLKRLSKIIWSKLLITQISSDYMCYNWINGRRSITSSEDSIHSVWLQLPLHQKKISPVRSYLN